MKPSDWTYLTVVIEGEALEIEGLDVWHHEWAFLDIGTIEVPHPSYPRQRHKLSPFAIEPDGDPVLFCAGELSNGVWCFYLPFRGQPARRFVGMTVNERLSFADLTDAFDAAIRAGERRRATHILIATGLRAAQAAETVAAILANPGFYGYADPDK